MMCAPFGVIAAPFHGLFEQHGESVAVVDIEQGFAPRLGVAAPPSFEEGVGVGRGRLPHDGAIEQREEDGVGEQGVGGSPDASHSAQITSRLVISSVRSVICASAARRYLPRRGRYSVDFRRYITLA
jgi:hypothetical protein